VDCFRQKIMSSSLYQKSADTVNDFAAQLGSVISEILNELVPVKKITRRAGKSTNQWLSEEAVQAKQRRRQLERRSKGF